MRRRQAQLQITAVLLAGTAWRRQPAVARIRLICVLCRGRRVYRGGGGGGWARLAGGVVATGRRSWTAAGPGHCLRCAEHRVVLGVEVLPPEEHPGGGGCGSAASWTASSRSWAGARPSVCSRMCPGAAPLRAVLLILITPWSPPRPGYMLACAAPTHSGRGPVTDTVQPLPPGDRCST